MLRSPDVLEGLARNPVASVTALGQLSDGNWSAALRTMATQNPAALEAMIAYIPDNASQLAALRPELAELLQNERLLRLFAADPKSARLALQQLVKGRRVAALRTLVAARPDLLLEMRRILPQGQRVVGKMPEARQLVRDFVGL